MRKENTEALLAREGIPFLPSLPCVEREEDTTLRSPEEVGIRILCLFCVSGYAFESSIDTFKTYLKEHNLWTHLTPGEESFLGSVTPNRKDVINFSWRCEALFLLMWAANLFETLGLPRCETDTSQIIAKMPSADESPWPFIRSLRLRSTSEILDASDLIYRLHWATRNSNLKGEMAPGGLITGIVQEWHHAINWITKYGEEEWDDVATDT